MDFNELLNNHREAYLNFFKIQKKQCEGSSEVLLEMKSKKNARIYNLYRFDCVEKNKDGSFEIIEFNNTSYLNHDLIEFDYNKLKIELHPFFWNGCEIHFKNRVYNFDDYRNWGKKWLDVNEEGENNNQELAELIHNIQPPRLINGEYTLSIDFGTSKIDSFIELFNVLIDMGVTKIKIDSSSMMD